MIFEELQNFYLIHSLHSHVLQWEKKFDEYFVFQIHYYRNEKFCQFTG